MLRLPSSPLVGDTAMAVARPVRALGVAVAVLWCLFLYRIFKAPSSVHGPGERYINFERDPNLDRGLRCCCSPAMLG